MSANIIISFDGSENDHDALALGRLLAQSTGGEVALAYVRHAHESDAARERAAAQDATAILERGAQWLGAPETERHVVNNASTSEGLAQLAQEHAADVIVFGSDWHTTPGHVQPLQSASAPARGRPDCRRDRRCRAARAQRRTARARRAARRRGRPRRPRDRRGVRRARRPAARAADPGARRPARRRLAPRLHRGARQLERRGRVPRRDDHRERARPSARHRPRRRDQELRHSLSSQQPKPRTARVRHRTSAGCLAEAAARVSGDRWLPGGSSLRARTAGPEWAGRRS